MITVNKLKKVYASQKKTGNMVNDFFNRQFTETNAVNSISFEIDDNQLVGFIGPNGAGKTTTLKMLSGILYPTSGVIKVNGEAPFEKRKEFLKSIAFVMGQKNQLIWELPAKETYRINKEIYEIPDNQYTKTLNNLLELLECGSFIHQPVKTLSLGQRMKVELIGALLHNPKVLFLDEPTIGLDIFAQTTIRNFILEYQNHYKATIILTSHYMQDVQQLTKRVILIDKGHLVYDGSLSALFETYAPNKIIKITVAKRPSNLEKIMKGLEYSYEPPVLTCAIPKHEISSVFANIIPQLDFTDITIENELIEDVIKKVFKKGE